MLFITDKVLFLLLAKRLGVSVSGTTRLTHLDLGDYAQETFQLLDLHTVQDALLAYCLHRPTPGIGESSWRRFIAAITR